MRKGSPSSGLDAARKARAGGVGEELAANAGGLVAEVVAAEIGGDSEPGFESPRSGGAAAVGIEPVAVAIGIGAEERVIERDVEARLLGSGGKRNGKKKEEERKDRRRACEARSAKEAGAMRNA